MTDSLSKLERSQLMSKVRGRGNRSTEQQVEQVLRTCHIWGWVKHPARIRGCPDFYFTHSRIAVFVDGCFWHACPKCGRLPKSRRKFWAAKIDENRRRDLRVRRLLRSDGHRVLTIWEHSIRSGAWLARLQRMLNGGSLERLPKR